LFSIIRFFLVRRFKVMINMVFLKTSGLFT
jgi:hypothetical protein